MNFPFPDKLTPKRTILLVALFIIVFVIVSYTRNTMMRSGTLGLSGNAEYAMAPSISLGRGEYAMDAVVMPEMNYKGTGVASPYPTFPPDAPLGESKIIQNAELQLLVDDIDVTAQLIEQVRIAEGGQVGNSSFGRYGSARTGDITIWVPSKNFNSALSAIKKGAIRVNNESINVSDVSAQFVDLEARLKNLRATESQYLEIMKRSGSIPDVLSVTRELSQTRQSIEQLQGQLNYLSQKIALSSIHITLTEEVVSTVGSDEWRPVAVIKNAFIETLRDLTGFIDTILIILVKLPMLILQLAFWVGIAYGLWRFGMFVFGYMTTRRLPGSGEKL